MKNYLKTWNLMRVLRLAAGIFFLVQGFVMADWLFIGAGILFTLIPIVNAGCCSTSACKLPARKRNEKTEEVSYEEVR